MPAAVAIPALIGGGASLGGAYLQSRSAKNAAKTQQQGADRAAGVMRDVYRDQQSLFAPYIQAGAPAASLLGRLVAPSAGMRFAAAPPQPFMLPSQQPPQPTQRPSGFGQSLGDAWMRARAGGVRQQGY